MMRPTRMRGFSDPYGILEHDLHLATEGAQIARLKPEQRAAVEQDVAARRLEQPKHDPAERRFATAGLAHQSDRLPGLDRERHAVDRLHSTMRAGEHPATQREVLADVTDLDQRPTFRTRAHTRMHAAG